ncbi:nuclear transport factor 2 family protein [Candidatus Fermentibacterales bacterium]|nr:nuclear transport factor 2 family protein [Candidatus Fermentibacterales bacterium]
MLLEVKRQIQEIVDRETRAWETKDVDLLLTVMHPDMVWPWPRTPDSQDPMDWELVMGRFDRARWRRALQHIFDSLSMVSNRRITRKIVVSSEGDGAFAVVDVDTLWKKHDGSDLHWKGRACKVYTRVGEEWKMIFQTGLLTYDVR